MNQLWHSSLLPVIKLIPVSALMENAAGWLVQLHLLDSSRKCLYIPTLLFYCMMYYGSTVLIFRAMNRCFLFCVAEGFCIGLKWLFNDISRLWYEFIYVELHIDVCMIFLDDGRLLYIFYLYNILSFEFCINYYFSSDAGDAS